MIDEILSGGWILALILMTYVITAMSLAIMREEKPDAYKDLSAPGEIGTGIAGPLVIAFAVILPLRYESWDLSQSQKWVFRLAFVSYAALLTLGLWTLISLI